MGRGLARDLGRRYLRLDCLADNDFLRGYYARAGYIACGEVEVAYPPPVGKLKLARFQKQVV
ncbi:MAG: hypothetical protein HC802_06390 [Caldilineaceae bacterium]|nr:hypothetical protein [Caldilineaceae bacterium]